MGNLHTFERYGLFDSRVPRYTSYPPANRFEVDVGRRMQPSWLQELDPRVPVSIYIHIPFCRRLCWFCACRTQGTSTLKPLRDYVMDLCEEIKAAREKLQETVPMARLHLGGGTPTLLPADLLDHLLTTVFQTFPTSSGFEFSVEVDPTEAPDEVLDCLAAWGLRRASIGVQDFAPKVQEAIGRPQSYEETERVAKALRELGIHSLNLDLLYGLPFQTDASLLSTLAHVVDLDPDRIALYGYAHVPRMSKRQAMIDTTHLPDTRKRYDLSERAYDYFVQNGLTPLGIDHFAKVGDSLAEAATLGQLRRNFQGYTDDPCGTLIGFGASAISKYRGGYVQNAVATGAYRERIAQSGLAGHKGYVMSALDTVIADMIERLMCDMAVDLEACMAAHPALSDEVLLRAKALVRTFPDAVTLDHSMLIINRDMRSLTRIIAASLDRSGPTSDRYSLAV
ncbi:MAG: oxygen-independent coproporphyrinogen III oxidase [Pseudomonadota bacterium]